MSHHTSAALPAVDGNLALRTESRSLVLIEGGLSRRRATQGSRRAGLTPAQGVRLLACGLAVVLAVVLCSALSDALRSGRALAALDPEGVVRRGYAVVLKDGKCVPEAGALRAGDAIEVHMRGGNVAAEVTDE